MADLWDEMDEIAGGAERDARRDQEAAEGEAGQLRLAGRSMTDVAWEAMHAGHRIRLAWSGGEAVGVPSAAIGDLVVIDTETGLQAINVAALSSIEVVEQRASSGRTGDRTVGSFVAWARMVQGHTVRIDMVGALPMSGTLVVTASDHLLLANRHGAEAAVARSLVATISVDGDPFLAL